MGVPLTSKILENINFNQQIVWDEVTGKPVKRPTPAGTLVWELTDGELQGFFIRVRKDDVGWYVRKRINKKPKQRLLGQYPNLNITDARQRAREWLAMMGQGIDPLQVKKDRLQANTNATVRANLTIEKVYRNYIASMAATDKPSTAKDRMKLVKWLEKSPIWKKSIFDITDEDIEKTYGPQRDRLTIASKKPAWGPTSISWGTLQKMYVYLSAAYIESALKYKISTSKEDSPFVRWRNKQPFEAQAPKTTLLPTNKEIGKQWLRALVNLHNQSHTLTVNLVRHSMNSDSMKPHFSVLTDYFLMVVLCGGRRSEMCKLKWTDVKFDDDLIIFDAKNTKNGLMGAVPLTPWMKEILRLRKQANNWWREKEDSIWVFPSVKHGKHLVEPRTITELLFEETGLKITSHDLRRTIAVEMFSISLSQDDLSKFVMAGLALQHAKSKTGVQSATTTNYLQLQLIVNTTRKAYLEREDNLRAICNLPSLNETKEVQDVDINDMSTLLNRVKNDPALKLQVLTALIGS